MNTTLNFTVGPSKLYNGVAENLIENIKKDYASLSHRSAEFSAISQNGITALRKFFNIPADYKIFYTYSATQGLELSLRALVEKKSIHFINGTFGWVWANIARKNGKEVCIKEEIFGQRTPLSLSLNEQKDTDMVCVTANETSSGIGYSADEIAEFSKTLPKETFLAVDITSSMGCISYDFSCADIWAFSVQKAMGLPAGLGLMIVSPKAYKKSLEREKKGNECGMHHSFSALEKKMEDIYQTPTTPNVLGIFSVEFVCNAFITDFQNVRESEKKTKEKAQFLYDFFDNHTIFKPFISDKTARSQTIIVIEGTLENIRKKKEELEAKGVAVGGGYGLNKKTQIRISNFPVHTMENMKALVKCF